ncbi:MAG TPA: hypothetical protein ENN67_06420 [Firmicutes bacterium]|nr:hypothetical protein [Bacillota bacterium]
MTETDLKFNPGSIETRIVRDLEFFKLGHSGETVRKIAGYVELLTKWNIKYRFSKFRSSDDIYKNLIVVTFAHSVYIPETNSIIDIGSGPGIPGLVVSLIRQSTPVSCLDSSTVSVEFMKYAKLSLDIPNLEIIQLRAEILSHNPEYREKYGTAVARAFAPIPIVLETVSGLAARTDSRCNIVIQTPISSSHRYEKHTDSFHEIGVEFDKLETPEFPHRDYPKVAFAIFSKTGVTPVRYPRKWSTMKKNPLF